MTDFIKLVAYYVTDVAEGMAGYRSACSYCRNTDCFKFLFDKRAETDERCKIRC